MNYKSLKNALFRICYRVNKKNLKSNKRQKADFYCQQNNYFLHPVC